MSTDMAKNPSVLFVCVHNAGRSQMAAAFLTTLSRGDIDVRSAGSQPADKINPAAVEAMAELGIDMSAEIPKVLTTEAVKESDVVITMGCGDECPYFPGKRYEDWVLEDPAGQGVDAVRPIRDEIKTRIEDLISSSLRSTRPSSPIGEGGELNEHRMLRRWLLRRRAGLLLATPPCPNCQTNRWNKDNMDSAKEPSRRRHRRRACWPGSRGAPARARPRASDLRSRLDGGRGH